MKLFYTDECNIGLEFSSRLIKDGAMKRNALLSVLPVVLLVLSACAKSVPTATSRPEPSDTEESTKTSEPTISHATQTTTNTPESVDLGTPAPLVMTINMLEYKYIPNEIRIRVGQPVTLNLINKGSVPHEIVIGRELVKQNETIPVGYETDLFILSGVIPNVTFSVADSGSFKEDEGNYVLSLPAGASAELSFTVTQEMLGDWEIGCFEHVGVHYNGGMTGTLIVTQ
jgi:plastocyanin